jgi:hypothetical protein
MNRSFKHALPTLLKARGRRVVLIGVSALAAVGLASAVMAQRGEASGGVGASIATSVVDQIGSSRVTSIDLQGSSLTVTGTATGTGADAARTLWYESVAAAAIAQQVPATSLTRQVVDPAGEVIESEHEALSSGGSPTAPTTAADLTSGLADRAVSVGASVGGVHYLPLLGGVAEVVIQPNDPTSFVKSAAENLGALIGPMGGNNRADLVTVVDASGTPLLVLGWTPGVGGTMGQGVGWQASGAESDAIYGPPSATP